MKKIFLNETEKQKIIADKEKAIMESFAKTYNKIKRVDENEIQGNPDVEFLKWEEMWEDSPKDMKAVMYFNKNMPENIWKKFLDKYRTDIQIAQDEFKSLRKNYGSSSMHEDNSAILAKHIKAGLEASLKEDGEDYEKLSREVQYGINPYQEQPDLTPQEGDTYTNVNVLTQDGTYEKRNVTVVSVYPENREALVRTDAGGDVIVSFDDLNGLNETLNEGLKQWIAGGLIALSTIGGVGKIYQLNQEKAKNHEIEMKYYNDVLSNTLNKMDDKALASLGTDINDKTRDLAFSQNYSREQLDDALSNYASKYIQSHPKEFGVSQSGQIQWLGAK